MHPKWHSIHFTMHYLWPGMSSLHWIPLRVCPCLVYWSVSREFMVLFLKFAQRQKHLRSRQSLTSCRPAGCCCLVCLVCLAVYLSLYCVFLSPCLVSLSVHRPVCPWVSLCSRQLVFIVDHVVLHVKVDSLCSSKLATIVDSPGQDKGHTEARTATLLLWREKLGENWYSLRKKGAV
jgi:hypothetical protein